MDKPVNDVETAKGVVTLQDMDRDNHPSAPMRDSYKSGIRPAANVDGYLTSVQLDTPDGADIPLNMETPVTITFLPGWFTLREGRIYMLQNGRRRVGQLELRKILTRRE